MAPTSAAQRVYRIEEFVLDPSKRALCEGDRSIALSSKGFDLLLLLVENSGRLLTRDEIFASVWAGTAVEEGNLSQNIFLLRKALRDGVDGRRFIQTVPGRGYQFVATVEHISLAPVQRFPSQDGGAARAEARPEARPVLLRSAVPASEPVADPAPEASAEPAPDRPQRAGLTQMPDRQRGAASSRRVSRRAWTVAASALVVLALAGWAGWRRWHHADIGHIEILLAKMDNQANDPEFDNSLDRALQIDLQQSPSLTLISGTRKRNILKEMQKPADTSITGDLAREVCQRAQGNAVLQPMIASIGGQYLLTITSTKCEDGHTLGDRKIEVANKAGILTSLDKLAEQVRHDIGESSSSIRNFDQPLFRESTASLEALKAYSVGERLSLAGKLNEAIAMFQRAVELDPNFAIAYTDMAASQYNLNDKADARTNFLKGYQLRQYANESGGFYIAYSYPMMDTGDLVEARKVLREWADTYPNEVPPRANLSNLANFLGDSPTAVKYADQVMALNTRDHIHNSGVYEISMRSYLHAGMLDKAAATAKEAEQYDASDPGIAGLEIVQAWLRHDSGQELSILAKSRKTPSETRVLFYAALGELAVGRVRSAEALMAEARRVASVNKESPDSEVDYDATNVRVLAELGLRDQALAAAAAMGKDDDSLDATYVLASVGDAAQAEAAVQKRLKENPDDLLLKVEYAPEVRAAEALRSGKPQDAIAGMQADRPFQLRQSFGPYVLGQAYMAAGQLQAAREEFQLLLDHPSIDEPPTPIAALSRLQLARIAVKEEHPAEATRQYDLFLAGWKDADQDLPVLAAARQERSALLHK